MPARVQLTVLGGCGAWPAVPGSACSGYLVECDGFRALIDPGYATLPRLLEFCEATDIGAVLVSHGHPDHCADLNPLLRARVLGARVLGAQEVGESPAPQLQVFAPPGALDAVLALDRPGMLDDAFELREFIPGTSFRAGPFTVRTWLLPHWLPNAGLRLQAAGVSLAYTGDTGPSPALLELARDADVFLAEATYPERVPGHSARYLSSARQAGEVAACAGAGQLVLTHLWPGTNPEAALGAATAQYGDPVHVATPGLVL
jgi:ribonuclease BN (tRNA processing enzyme)